MNFFKGTITFEVGDEISEVEEVFFVFGSGGDGAESACTRSARFLFLDDLVAAASPSIAFFSAKRRLVSALLNLGGGVEFLDGDDSVEPLFFLSAFAVDEALGDWPLFLFARGIFLTMGSLGFMFFRREL